MNNRADGVKKNILFVPDVDRLRRKLAHPPPLLGKLYERFRARLETDPEFRRHHVFLPALLGDPAALAEAKAIIMEEARDPLRLASNQSPASRTSAQDSLDRHVWCVAPRAMRLAVYFTWIDAQGAWTPEERRDVAADLMKFFHHYVIPVLRARVPAGHNQQLSMTFCCAVAGHALSCVPAVAAQARVLRDYALPKLHQTLGLMPVSGYSGEGSTYQSVVVSALVMWVGVFLGQLGETDVWTRKRRPNGASLAATLRMEAALGSCGGLLPPWDQYGWSRLHNLAARTLWAGIGGELHLLEVAEAAWEEESFIAWRADDRLWTILYWPDVESQPVASTAGTNQPVSSPVLTGWSVPSVGAAIEHRPARMRVMAAWDRSSGSLQGLCRGQANPNHLMIDLAGEPITGDGWDDGSQLLFPEVSNARTLNCFSDIERQLVAQQYGSLDKWLRNSQQGFLGASCAIVVDEWDSYFPRHDAQGWLVFEERTPARHTFASESAAYYQPAFDVIRMRRTVSVGASGVVWVVDDIRSESPHRFTWRAWFRRGLVQEGPLRLRLGLPSGVVMTMAWLAEGEGALAGGVTLSEAPNFPCLRKGLAWPETGSTRCDLAATGHRVRFVACLVPYAVDELRVRQTGSGSWEALWNGGGETFERPSALDDAALPTAEPPPVEQEVLCDLDEAPFRLLEAEDAELLAALDNPAKDAWRRTTAAMQTLTIRRNKEAMPKLVALLQDTSQSYTVHSVAAWCLGHARYTPALEPLRRMANIPEVNTALRAGWAVERLSGGAS